MKAQRNCSEFATKMEGDEDRFYEEKIHWGRGGMRI